MHFISIICFNNFLFEVMVKYISILRGINVGGQRKVPMTVLKSLYEELKFKDIISYIQSGNIIFQTNQNITEQILAAKIHKKISEKFNFDVPVIVRTIQEMESIIAKNPFLKMQNIDLEKLHVTFLEEVPGQNDLQNIEKYDYSPDKFIIINKEIFLYCPGGYGKTKLSNNFFENKLKLRATTRNWKTVNKLAGLSSD